MPGIGGSCQKIAFWANCSEQSGAKPAIQPLALLLLQLVLFFLHVWLSEWGYWILELQTGAMWVPEIEPWVLRRIAYALILWTIFPAPLTVLNVSLVSNSWVLGIISMCHYASFSMWVPRSNLGSCAFKDVFHFWLCVGAPPGATATGGLSCLSWMLGTVFQPARWALYTYNHRAIPSAAQDRVSYQEQVGNKCLI